MKRFYPYLLGLALLLVAFWLFRHWSSSGDAVYRTTEVSRGAITQAVTATGTLNPVVNVQVGSQISGNVSQVVRRLQLERKSRAGRG